MKLIAPKSLLMAAVGLLSVGLSDVMGQACAEIGEEVRAAAAAAPQEVNAIVADALNRNPTCSCEIVRGAISGSNANADTIGSIVATAVRIAPDQYQRITECAIAMNPDAAPQVSRALASVFGTGGKSSGGGKAYSGKGMIMGKEYDPFATDPEEIGFRLFPNLVHLFGNVSSASIFVIPPPATLTFITSIETPDDPRPRPTPRPPSPPRPIPPVTPTNP